MRKPAREAEPRTRQPSRPADFVPTEPPPRDPAPSDTKSGGSGPARRNSASETPSSEA